MKVFNFFFFWKCYILDFILKPLEEQRFLRYFMINGFGFNNTLLVLFIPNPLLKWTKENILWFTITGMNNILIDY